MTALTVAWQGARNIHQQLGVAESDRRVYAICGVRGERQSLSVATFDQTSRHRACLVGMRTLCFSFCVQIMAYRVTPTSTRCSGASHQRTCSLCALGFKGGTHHASARFPTQLAAQTQALHGEVWYSSFCASRVLCRACHAKLAMRLWSACASVLSQSVTLPLGNVYLCKAWSRWRY